VEVPAQTTPEERALLEELTRISHFHPRSPPTGTAP